MLNKKIVGSRIKEIRKHLRLTQKELAKPLDISGEGKMASVPENLKLFTPAKFKLNRLTPKAKVKLTGTCFPGDRKVFVGTNGDMHLCEAISESLPIGNVSKGFYFDQIRKIVREFNEEIIKNKCWHCDIWFFCNACFLTALQGEKFDIDCPKEIISASLKKRLEFLEKKHEEKLRNLSINSVDDYLEFLR